MGLEAATYISELVSTNPSGADDYATADDHLRLLKAVLLAQFPNFTAAAVTPTVAQMNFVAGVTSAIQTQIDGKAPTAHSHASGEISGLDVSDITTGIFAAAFIPNLNASKINAGIFAAGRIPTHTGDVTGQTALTIANNAVSLAKMADMATASFLGRNTAATGDPEVLSATIARAILNVENGATADQTNAEIKTAYETNANTNAFTDALLSKLNGVEANATADQTAGEIEALVNHDSLLGFVANEHINHGSVSVIAGNGLSGGGTIAANRTLTVGAGSGISVSTSAIAFSMSGFAQKLGTTLIRDDEFVVRDSSSGNNAAIKFGEMGLPIITTTGTTDTLNSNDMNKFLEYTSASAVTVTLNSGTGNIGNFILIKQSGAGKVTLAGASTKEAANGVATAKQHSVMAAVKIDATTWAVYGDTV